MISIIIPTYNHCEDLLKPCIQSILSTTIMNDKVEIIVVANGCTDNTKAYLAGLVGFKLRVVWFDQPLGFPRAVNEGLKVLTDETDYAVIMNNDCVLMPQPPNEWINILIELFDKPSVGIAGPLRLYDYFTKQYYIHFFVAAIKHEVIKKIGLLDEAYGIGNSEDTEYCIRAKLAGYTINNVKFQFDPKTTMKLGSFPIVHAAHKTVVEVPGWEENVNKNIETLKNKYGHLPPEPFEPENFVVSPEQEEKPQLRLNLGCGDLLMDGFVNVDLYNPMADLRIDIRKLPYEDNSVDLIVASHIIEHFDVFEAREVLKEWRRVMKPGAEIHLETPDFLACCKKFVESDLNVRAGLYGQFFAQAEKPGQVHKFLYTDYELTHSMLVAGFVDIQRHPAMRYWQCTDINMKLVGRKPR